MCNNYAARKSAAEVAAHFGVKPPNIASFNAAEDIYPGYSGMVVRSEESVRRLEAMTWGFPHRPRDMKPGSKPLKVNNARDDQLANPRGLWKNSFEKRRCLIPLTAWAEAEGPKGSMTKTWLSLHGADLFAAAGVWRPTDEWGDAYSMVMTNACAQMTGIHTRMPVIVRPEHYNLWMLGSPEDAMGLVQTCDDTLHIDRTPELWFKKKVVLAAPGGLI